MKIEVRKYQESDLESVNLVLFESFQVTKGNFFDSQFVELVALCDDVICGYLLLTKILNPVLNKYYYLVDYVCVLSKYQGLGVGEELMNCAENIARENGAIYLQLTCSTYRSSAHHLYENCGYIKRDSDIFRKVLE